MKARLALLAMVMAMMLFATACGRKAENGGGDSAVSSVASANPSVSRYDSGPRAGESAADENRAKQGETLFQAKGCSACHAFGLKLSGPDLKGVTMRRTALWMENQILHPEVMTKQDPISHELFAKFSLQMPNQGLTPEEARAVIEFLKHKDHEASEGQEAKKEDEK